MPLGDWATWTNVVVTAFALVAAGFAVYHARREANAATAALAIEQERDRNRDAADVERREHAQRAEQADKVAVWFERVDSADFGRVKASGRGAIVMNSSSLPIYDVSVIFHGSDGPCPETAEALLIPPGEDFLPMPQSVEEFFKARVEEAGPHGNVPCMPAVSFRDTAGRVWERNHLGILRFVRQDVFGEVDVKLEGVITATAEVTKTEDPE